ncbi:MAG: sugar phosphate isomerase/epimerase family protein [Pirellulales bacterium]
MLPTTTRREFLKATAAVSASVALASTTNRLFAQDAEPVYKISLAEYSLHRTIDRGELDPLDFAPYTKKEFGIDAVEHWNRPFFEKAGDAAYLADMKKRADDAGVKSLLIMVDGEGNLGDPDEESRTEAVQKHHKWVEAAKALGCHSIRVNAASRGSYEEQLNLAADGLRQLSEFAAKHEMNVIVENHGGLSSNGAWLAAVMKAVDLPNCGTLPDFGNFRLGRGEEYDRYKGVAELMPFAKAVSAKSYAFDESGNETTIDYPRMMKIVVDSGYHGYVGIEFEGGGIPEVEGIHKTKALLDRIRGELA